MKSKMKLFLFVSFVLLLFVAKSSAELEYSVSGHISENSDGYWDDDEWDIYHYTIFEGETLDLKLDISNDVEIFLMIFDGEDEEDIDHAIVELLNYGNRGSIRDIGYTSHRTVSLSYNSTVQEDVSVAVFSFSDYSFSEVSYKLYSNIEEGVYIDPVTDLIMSIIVVGLILLVHPLIGHRDIFSAAIGLLYVGINALAVYLLGSSDLTLFASPLILFFQRRLGRKIFETQFCSVHDQYYPSRPTPTITKILWFFVILPFGGMTIDLLGATFRTSPIYLMILLLMLIFGSVGVYLILKRIYDPSSLDRQSYGTSKYGSDYNPLYNPSYSTSSYQPSTPPYKPIAESQSQGSYCSNCGEHVTSQFCQYCGSKN